MKTKRILICIMVLALMVSLFAACGHKHEYSQLVAEVAPTCDTAGTKAHYTCSGCAELFDENKQPITDLVIQALGHDYTKHEKVEATLDAPGLAEHYTCSRCDKYFVQEGTTYTAVEYATLVIPQLGGVLVEATEATLLEEGNVAHWLVEGTPNRYFVLQGESYVEVTYEDVVVARKTYTNGALELAPEAVTAFDLKGLTEQAVLDAVKFSVEASDGTTYVVSANSIEDFATTPGKNRVFNFKLTVENQLVFEKQVSLDLYNVNYVLCEPGTTFADGDKVLFVNVNQRAMSNSLSYAGYAAGSSGTTQIALEGKMENGMYKYANIEGAEDLAILTLQASKSLEGTFYVVRPDGKLLCGGMGYTQWLEFSNNNSLAQSFEITVQNNYAAIVHGQQFSYSYLRIWNRYGEGLDAFFVTTTHDYGDDYYIYRLTKDYTGCAHEYSQLVAEVAPTCDTAGNVAHYTCAQCGGYFDTEYNALATVVVPATGHEYTFNAEVPATPVAAGVKAYYFCSTCSQYFVLVDEAYVKVTAEELVIPQLQAQLVAEVLATFENTGLKAHYALEFDGTTTYMVKEGDNFVTVTYDQLVVPAKEYDGGEITLANDAVTEYSFVKLNEKTVLAGIVFNVVAKDGSVVTVKPTSVENFNPETLGAAVTYKFAYEVAGNKLFEKEVALDVYEPTYTIVSDVSMLKDGDMLLLGNVKVCVMSNFVSYEGYAAGSQATTKVSGTNFDADLGVYKTLIPGDNAEVMPLLLKASADAANGFHLIRPDGMYLCVGMGYTQWYAQPNGDLAMSFEIFINDQYQATIHGLKYAYSYLRVWNRYASGKDAFFVTNSATYGDNIYLYRLEKSYEPHTQHDALVKVDAKAPTCDTLGNVEYFHCPRNGQNYDASNNRIDDVTIAMVAHTYSDLVAATPAECGKDGNIAYYQCTVCNKYFDTNYQQIDSYVIPALDHSFTDLFPAVAPDCVTAGNVEYCQCTICNKYFDKAHALLETIEVAATGHSYSQLVAGTPATCTQLGTVDHYTCTICNRVFDATYQQITNAYVDMHTYGTEGKCTACGHARPLSVAEAKAQVNSGNKVTVRGVVVGNTGNYDGGYVWVLLKDLTTNEICGIRKSVEKDGVGVVANPVYGYSYAPNMYFQLGDILEVPVYVKTNTATVGGEAGKIMFLYAGEDITAENNKEIREQFLQGTASEYRLNLDEAISVIDSQESLEAFCLSSQPQWKLVKIVGTEEKPLKITTRSATTAGVGEISREYLYLYYDNAKSLDDLKVNGACPVFSNFGNQYNLSSMLSSILFGQSQYEGLNFDEPYYFIGEVYCVIVGGSTAYYHFAVLNQGDIFNEGFDGPIPIMAKTATKAFFNYQAENAAKLGVEVAKNITSAVGVTGVVHCEDMVRFGVAATQNPILSKIWSSTEYSTSYKKADGKTVNITVDHAVMALDQCKTWITPYYKILGAKSGWLNYTSETRPYYVCNCLVAVEGPNNTVLVGYVYNKRQDNGDDNVYHYLNILYQILLNKSEGLPTAELEAQLACDSCAGVIIPADGSVPDGADFFSEESQYVHFTKNSRELITTASTWKTFTCLTACRYFTEEQLDREITVLPDDLNSIGSVPAFEGGETITVRDALYFTMLPSSNICPTILGRVIGEELVRNGQN